jgi:hypothetical protein
MNQDELRQEAEQLAKGKKTAELSRMAFVHAYVANHELRVVCERLDHLERIVYGVGAVVVVSVLLSLIKIVTG